MRKLFINGKILAPEPLPDNYAILVKDDRILEVAELDTFPDDIEVIDAGDCWITPGLIDIHVHGGGGNDTMDNEGQILAEMARYFASTGVTSFLPTTVAASNPDVTAAIDRIKSFTQPEDGARVLGIHLEGPYLGHRHKGAQPEQHLRSASPDEYMPWLDSGLVKVFTVAPEVDGVLDLISEGSKRGVRFAVGHSSADYETMIHAIDRGLSQATHTFNGMPQLHHREPGVLGAVLTDQRVFAQIIADGVHLHPAIVKLIMDAKGVDRSVLITDATRAAGASDGNYQLGDQTIIVKEGIARTATGSLAGSTLSMSEAVRNAVKFTGRPFDEVIRSATDVAANSLGLEDQIGSIKPGMKADIIFFDQEFTPRFCMISGNIVFQK